MSRAAPLPGVDRNLLPHQGLTRVAHHSQLALRRDADHADKPHDSGLELSLLQVGAHSAGLACNLRRQHENAWNVREHFHSGELPGVAAVNAPE